MKNSISIDYIKWNAFRSFKDEQETGELPPSGLFGIVGKNKTTTGSSGSGKTNFHYAISYALGYCPVPSTQLQSWLTKDPMQVEMGLSTPAGKVVIKRGEETSINIDGARFEGAKIVESKLREIIGLPVNLIEALTFRQQKMPGRFLSMTDGEKKDFLCTLLGLEDIENQIELANKKASESLKEWTEYSTISSTLRSQISIPKVPVLKNTNDLQDKARELSQYYSQYIKDLDRLKPKAVVAPEAAKLIVMRDDLLSTSNSISVHIESLRLFAKELDFKITPLLSEIKNRQENIRELEKVRLAIRAIEEAVCPTCNQQVLNEENLATLKISEKKALDYESQQASIQNTLNNIYIQKESHMGSIRDFLVQLNEIGAKIRGLSQKINDVQMVFDAGSREEYNEMKSIKESAEDEIDDIIRQIQEIDKNNSFLQNTYALESNRHNELMEHISKVEARGANSSRIMNEESDLAAMLKGFLGAIFAEVLVEIASETNDMLKQLPNVASTTIQFDTEVVSQKGKTRQEIRPVFYKNGESVSIQSGLSGGQFTSVELAVDLAIGKIIGQRTGLSLNWLILDESFEGHDVPVKEACLELLKNAAKDKLIFVIDHATEVNAYFDKCIMIESNNDCSVVTGVV